MADRDASNTTTLAGATGIPAYVTTVPAPGAALSGVNDQNNTGVAAYVQCQDGKDTLETFPVLSLIIPLFGED